MCVYIYIHMFVHVSSVQFQHYANMCLRCSLFGLWSFTVTSTCFYFFAQVQKLFNMWTTKLCKVLERLAIGCYQHVLHPSMLTQNRSGWF